MDAATDAVSTRAVPAVWRYVVTGRVLRSVADAGLDETDVVSCVCSLEPTDFHKSQEQDGRPGHWLDIYRPVYLGERMYLKVGEDAQGAGYVLLSFCLDGAQH